ncbi:SAM-dependent methyltransferase [Palleronia sp. LCG004]|uniref:SAM-dependent methyltransferase n=1 Tax=Palleronia sp. LCG004 TaxID=3079304 RepID=UPI0029432BF7|nr:SAM-dependent methyltransferase [Palleronia sp. LCG004]WOI56974.1 SAM-dependent methyltransferase [Palleronia sp. LCG004]
MTAPVAAGRAHLLGLYAETDDPWNFRSSSFEAERFAAVLNALPRSNYESALELGCGNGELSRRIAPRCLSYTGLDAVPTALAAARKVVPNGLFVEGFLPCPLPGTMHDLVLLSEVLYFLAADAIRDVAGRIDAAWPRADVVTVTWRGPTGHLLSGEDAFAEYSNATQRQSHTVETDRRYRIAVFAPLPLPSP